MVRYALLALIVVVGCREDGASASATKGAADGPGTVRHEKPRLPTDAADSACALLSRELAAKTLGVPADSLEMVEQPPFIPCRYTWRSGSAPEIRQVTLLSADVHEDPNKARRMFAGLTGDKTIYRVDAEEFRPILPAGEEPPGEKIVFRMDPIADLADEAAVARDQPGADRAVHVRLSNLTLTLTADFEVEGGPMENYDDWRQRTTELAKAMFLELEARYP